MTRFSVRSRAEVGEVGAVDTEDMKQPEWAVLSDPSSAPRGEDFLVTEGRRRTVSITGSTPRSSWSGFVK